MDYQLETSPDGFAAAVAGSAMPAGLKAAVEAVWAATDTSDPVYEIHAATGDLWSVVRVAAIRRP